MSHLDARQRQAVAQLQDLTNGGDDDVAISVLDSVGWDVQRAADLIFGTASTSANSIPMEAFDIDDSSQNRPANVPSAASSLSLIARPLLSVFAFPLHVLSNIFRFIFGILRIPIPQLRFATLNFYRPLPRGPRPASRGGPDRWIRELEEETGAVCIGTSNSPRATSTATYGAGPSTQTVRPRAVEDGRKLLPDFTLGSYDEVLRTCQREARIGCIILVSEEHDNVTEFKRSTLTDTTFVKMLYDNNIMVWGGDVRDQDAWSAAEKLQVTTYPFVAFLALQPRRNPASSTRTSTSQPPTLTVLSRHQGPCTPSASGPGPTSAQTLVDHLTHQVLPRVTPFLDRLHATQRERERDRQLREEQDQAFRDSARRDKERIEGKMEEERREREKARLKEEEEYRKVLEKEERRRAERVRVEWRRWARRAGAGETKEGNGDARGMRIAVRMPTGGRVVKAFENTATLTALYAFVDTQLIPAELSPEDDPENPPEPGYAAQGSVEGCIESRIGHSSDPMGWWGFKLVLGYPRREIQWKRDVRLVDVESLRGGGQVVVEPLGNSGGGREDEDEDGYATEDSE